MKMFKHLKIRTFVWFTRKKESKNNFVFRQLGVRRIHTSCELWDEKKPKMIPCPNTGSGRGFYKTLIGVVLGTGAVVVVARNNDEFRDWLKENVPGSDEFITFVAAERTSRLDYIMRRIESLEADKDSPLGMVTGAMSNVVQWFQSFIESENTMRTPSITKPPCDAEGKPYNPKKVVDKRMKEIDEDKKAIEEERRKELAELEAIELAKKKKKEASGKTGDEPPLKSKDEIEKELAENLARAINSYSDGICFLRSYTDTVKDTVESSVEKQDPKIWPELQKKTTKTNAKVKTLLEEASEAETNARKAYKEYTDPKRPDTLSEGEKKEYMNKLQHLKNMREEFIRQRNMANVTNTYWTLVKQARGHFHDQLSTLFPELSSSDKSLKLAEAEMDLFILYAFQTILHYQKELDKLDLMSKANLKAALEHSKIGDIEHIECVIERELAKERKKICEEYKNKLHDLKADCEMKANEAIKSHNAMHTEILQEALAKKEEEVTKKMKRQLEERLSQEKTMYHKEMDELLERLTGMEDLMKKRAIQETQAVDSMFVWCACEGLVSAITCERDCGAVVMRSLGPEIRAIQLAAPKDDELVQAVIKAIPRIAYDRGIFGEPALKERFANTARICKRVALLPEGGASLPMMLISYIQSLLVTSPTPPIPCSEMQQVKVDANSFNTFEILEMANYWMQRGDWYQVLRYMSMLHGAARVVAQDFVEEVKNYLETKQAADVLLAHAAVASIAT